VSAANYNLERRGWRRPLIHVFDIDVALTAVVYERRPGALNFLGRGRPSAVEDYALEGRVVSTDRDVSSSLVIYLSGYESPSLERNWDDADPRSPCFLSTDVQAGSLGMACIYIRSALFRRLVELHSTKRIDCLRLSVKLDAHQTTMEEAFAPARGTLLEAASHPYFRHARGQLLSVHTALAGQFRPFPDGIAAFSELGDYVISTN